MLKKINEATNFIKSKTDKEFEFGIILGTGLGGLVNEINIELSIPYKEIPHFPVSTVQGHSGNLIIGELSGKRVVAMQGRFHFYEGYTMQELTFPVRVMKFLGVKKLLVSNAAGGMNANFEVGDIMIIKDHINLFPTNPLIGKNYDELGPRFPDMSKPYDLQIIETVENVAKKNNIKVQKGIYVGVSGPTFETPAEYKYMNIIGGDAVGMSTVPEVIVARHMDIPCFAFSIITDLGVDGEIVEVSHEEVQIVAQKAEKILTKLVKLVLAEL
jgi:purine-nucleoside phosphorylase